MKGWMVRAGRGGKFFDSFEEGNYVAIGWNQLGALTQYSDRAEIKDAYIKIYGNENPNRTANAVAMIYKFRDDMPKDDFIITYSPERRLYKIGLQLIEQTDGTTLQKPSLPDGTKIHRTVIDDTLPGGPREKTITYVAPWHLPNREAWEVFTERFGNRED